MEGWGGLKEGGGGGGGLNKFLLNRGGLFEKGGLIED